MVLLNNERQRKAAAALLAYTIERSGAMALIALRYGFSEQARLAATEAAHYARLAEAQGFGGEIRAVLRDTD